MGYPVAALLAAYLMVLPCEQEQDVENIHVELVLELPRGKKGHDVLLRDGDFVDIKSNKIGKDMLRKLLRDTVLNGGRKESVLFVHAEKADKDGLISFDKSGRSDSVRTRSPI